MTIKAISAASAREAVHVFLLKRLEGLSEPGKIVVKGGVNLRLFFGSVRYSEDIDLDEYRGQVVEFLPEGVRADHDLDTAWDEMQLTAASLIEAATILRRDQ